jgi:hypothetical protein
MIDRIYIAGAWPAVVVGKDLFEVVSFDCQAVMIDAHQGGRHHVVAHCADRFRHCITVAQPVAQGSVDLCFWWAVQLPDAFRALVASFDICSL